MKLDDHRQIERLEQSIKALFVKYSPLKKASDLVILIEDVLLKIKDFTFL